MAPRKHRALRVPQDRHTFRMARVC
jgi:hypothetical protein